MSLSIATDLLRACQKGDIKAQTAFYNHYKKRLLGICRRYARTNADAEDIFQEAFIKVFLKMGEIKHPEAVYSWTKSIVIRTAIDHYRKNKSLSFANEQLDSLSEVPEEADAFSVLDALEKEEVVHYINLLPDGYRMIVNLYLIDGFEHHEIADILGISVGTSKSQLSRAKALLRKTFIENGIKSYEKG